MFSAFFMAKITASTNSLDRIAALKAEIESLQQSAISELMERRNALSHELAEVDAELSKLTGKAADTKRKYRRREAGPGKSLPLQELKELLAVAPDKTLNVRKEGLELANIKTLATANPHLLRLGGKGAWPTVTLLK
jgi:predicted  nucleic acid-binding Zn-ribbon protein